MASPKAADFPRPLPAVSVTVVRSVFSVMATTNCNTDLAWKKTATALYLVWLAREKKEEEKNKENREMYEDSRNSQLQKLY